MSDSNVVDSKVVELSMQNKEFESNANQSISTLEKLKKSLKFDDTTKGIDKLNPNISTLTAGIKTLSGAMDTVKVSASMSIAEIAKFKLAGDAIDYVKGKFAELNNLMSDFTIKQIDAGWGKYEEKTQSVQTIMAATGKTIEDVNGQLEKLNWFTDETSYNYTDMTNNIGKFTNNGVELGKAVTAMQGIGTWASISGANMNEASRAMYNLSQAISVGSVKLIDWKSIQNANMATTEFKQTAIDTAEAMNLLTKQADGTWKTLAGHTVTANNFTDSLKDDWFTADVLLQTLDKYGGFTDKLYDFMDSLDTDVTTSTVLSYIDEFAEKGSLDNISDAAKKCGLSVEDLNTALTELASEEFAFGRKAFRAAQEAKTLTEAFDATRDAVSTAWMNTFELLFGNYEQAKHLWTDLANDMWDIFAGPVNNLNDKLSEAFDTTRMADKSDWEKITESGIVSPAYMNALKKVAIEHGAITEEMAEDEDWFSKALNDNLIQMGFLEDAYSSLMKGGDVDQDILDRVNELRETDEAFKDLTDSLKDYSEEDIAAIVFGNGQFDGNEELEKSLDDIINKLGLTQDDGAKTVAVLQSLGLLGGEAWANYTDEELKALGMNEEQIEQFRKLQDEGKEFSDILKDVGIEQKSGRDLWIGSLYNGMEALKNILGVIGRAWDSIFPASTSESIYNFLKWLNESSEKISNFTKRSLRLRLAFRGLFAVLDIVRRVVVAVASGFWDLVKSSGFLNFVSDLIANVSKAILKFRRWLIETDGINKAVRFVTSTIKAAASAVKNLIDSFLNIPIVSANIKRFKTAFSSAFKDFGPYMSEGVNRIKDFIKRVKDMGGLKKENIGAILKDFKENVLDYFLNFPGFKKIGAAFDLLRSDIANAIRKIGKTIWDYFSDLRTKLDGTFAGKFLGFIMDTIASIKDKLAGLKGIGGEGGLSLKGIFGSIIDAVGGFVSFLGKLAKKLIPIALIVLPIIGIVKIVKSVASLFFSFPKLMNNVKDAIGSIGDYFNAKKQAEQADAIWTIAKSIALIVGALYLLTTVDSKKLLVAAAVLVAIGGLLVGIFWAINKIGETAGEASGIKGIFSKLTDSVTGFIDAKKTETMSKALRNVAISIGILVAAVWVLAQLDTTKMLIAVGVIALLTLMLTGVMWLLSKMKSSKQSLSGSVALLAIALSVGLLVKAINDLQVDDNTGKRLAIVMILLGSLTAVAFVLSKFKIQGTLGGAVAMLAIAASVGLLVRAVNSLKVDNSLMRRLAVVEILLISMAGIAALLSAFKVKVKLSTSVGLIAMAGSIYILVKAISGLSTADPEGVRMATKVILELLTMLTVVMVVTRFLKPSLTSLLGIAALALVVGGVLAILAALPYDETLVSKVDAFCKLLLALTAATAILSVVGMLGGPAAMLSGLASLGILVLAMTAVAGILAIVNTLFGGKGFDKAKAALEPAFEFMSWLMTEIGEVLGSIIGGVLSGATSTLPQVAENINAVVDMLSGLNTEDVDFEGINNIASAIGKVSWEGFKIGIENFVLNALGGPTTTESFAQAADDVAGIITSWNEKLAGIEEVKSFDSEQITSLTDTVTAISGAGLETAVNDFIAKFLDGLVGGEGMTATESFAQSADDVIDIISTWNSKTTEMSDIHTFDSEQVKTLAETVTTISGAGLETAVNNFIVSFLDGLKGGKGMTATESFAQSASDVVDIISTWNEKTSGMGDIKTFDAEQVNTLAETVTTISGAGLETAVNDFISGILGKLSGSGHKSATESFAEAATDVAGIIMAWNLRMAVVEDIKGVDPEKITAMADAVKAVSSAGLGLAVNDFISGIIGKISGGSRKSAAESFAEAAEQVAGLVMAWNLRMAVIEDIKGVDPEKITAMVNAVKAVSEAGLGEAANNFITGIIGKIMGGKGKTAVESFGDAAEQVAGVIEVWNQKMGSIEDIHEVNAGKITAMTNAVNAVSDAGLGVAINNFKTEFFDKLKGDEGKSSIEHFGEAAGQLATVLNDWQTQMDGLDEITGPPEGAIQTIIDAIDEIPTSGLFDKMKNFFTDDDGTSVETFSKNATSLGDALVNWKTNMESLGDNIVTPETLSENIERLKEAFDQITTDDLFGAFLNSLGEVFGAGKSDQIEDFKTNATNLGEALGNFASGIGGDFNPELFKDVAKATKSLGEGIAGITQLALTAFGENGEKANSLFGAILTGFKTLSEGTGDYKLDLDSFEVLGKSAKKLGDGVTALAEVDLKSGDINDEGTRSNFIAAIGDIKDAIESLKDVDTSGVDKVSDATTSLSDVNLSSVNSSSSDAGAGAAEALESGIASKSSDVVGAMSDVIGAANDAIRGTYDLFERQGRVAIFNFISGMSGAEDYTANVAKRIAEGAKSALSITVGDAGENFVYGFAGGITLRTYVAVEAARAMAQAAIDKVKAVTREHSPSKITEGLGKFFGQGFEIGITKKIQDVSNVSGELGTAATESLNRTVRGISAILSSNIDSNPVIRPVLDLSEIQNGAGMIGDMLNISEPVDVIGSMNSISNNTRYTSNQSSDILSALNSLEKTLSKPRGGDTYIVDGITYDDGSNITSAVRSLVQAAKVSRRM